MKSALEIDRLRSSKWKSFFSYLGWVIGAIGTCTTIYLGFFQKKAPNLEYDIVNTTNFINKNETAASLKIFVDSLDIQQNRLNISAFTIKVQNKGTDNLRHDDYDKGLFGLRIKGGELLEYPTLTESSNDHVYKVYPQSDSLTNKRFVNIPNLSLDVDDYYMLRIVLLHSIDSIPSFETEGKIIGQKDIIVNKALTPSTSFWSVTLGGNWLVHLVRFLIYVFSIPLAVLVIVLPFAFISDRINRSKRKHIARELLKNSKLLQFVRNEYIEDGEMAIENLHEIYEKGEDEVTTQLNKSKRYLGTSGIHNKKNRETLYLHSRRVRRIEDMIDKGYLHVEEGKIIFNKEAKQSVDTIYDYLKENGLLSVFHYHYDTSDEHLREYLDRK